MHSLAPCRPHVKPAPAGQRTGPAHTPRWIVLHLGARCGRARARSIALRIFAAAGVAGVVREARDVPGRFAFYVELGAETFFDRLELALNDQLAAFLANPDSGIVGGFLEIRP